MTAAVFRLTGADFSGKGLPNAFPFISKADLEYGFDFRSRASRLVDLAGKHTLTPYRVDQAGAQVNVIDPAIISDASGGLGINVVMGHLRTNLPVAAIPTGGAKQFTVMVVGGYSGIAIDPAKVVGTTPNTAVFFEYGANVSSTGFTLGGAIGNGTASTRIESGGDSLLLASKGLVATAKQALFLTFDGTNWTLYNKSAGTTATGTNTSLLVGANPIAVNGASAGGMVALGGHFRPDTTIHGAAPTLFQSAMWNRALTVAEIETQYQQTKSAFSTVGV